MSRSKKEIVPTQEPAEETEYSETSSHKYAEQLLKFKKDRFGFIRDIDYHFNSDGSINWRGMIQKEYLVPNRDVFKNKNVDLKDIDVTTLPDNQLLILLGGIKELAQIRGFENVEYEVIQATPEYVAVKCTITWTDNFETNFQKVSFSALADAHLDNTKDFAKNFLMAIAENRAFIRCVRNFLKINIVGNDEIGKSDAPALASNQPSYIESNAAPGSSGPASLLRQTMSEYNISFEQIKDRALQKNMEGADQWNCVEDIAPLSMFTIISAIKSKNKKK